MTTRTLVFVVVYEAERHIVDVLERIPLHLYDSPSVDFLFIDDASRDSSAELARDWLRERRIHNAVVLKNSENQGYGGNQKLGYTYALQGDYDVVVLLHGDGQYAPELLETFVQRFESTGADIILGSRLFSKRKAASGGMPIYKIAGNRVLTKLQNLITGKSLSEYHTGYRAYSVDFLRKIPFARNTNGFHFDTQILLQAFFVGAKISEISIPTHYGDEICRVNGVGYAANVLLSTAQYRLHRLGMLCSLKYRRLSEDPYPDKTEIAYSSHVRALKWVSKLRPGKVLDLGCGAGYVSQRCLDQGAHVVGVDRRTPPESVLSKFIPWDLEERPVPVNIAEYDLVLLLDVIEHLNEPEEFLIDLRHQSKSPGDTGRRPTVILTTPNIAFLSIRMGLALGRFNYAERGILDITHKRLFTKRSLLTMLEECGYTVERVEGIGAPFGTLMDGRLGRAFGWCSQLLARIWPSGFGFQLLVVATPRAGLAELLSSSRAVLPEPRGKELSSARGRPSRQLKTRVN